MAKVKVTNAGYLRIMEDCKCRVEKLTDLPTEGVKVNTRYYVYDTDLYYTWDGTEWKPTGGEIDLGGSGGGGETGGSDSTTDEDITERVETLENEVNYEFACVPVDFDAETNNRVEDTVIGVTSTLQHVIGFVNYVTDLLTLRTAKIPSYVGMVIYSTKLANEDSVKEVYGGISWRKIENRFLFGASRGEYVIGAEGGEFEHTLTGDEIPGHDHNMVHTHTTPETVTGNQSTNHTHTVNGGSCTITSSGTHTHTAYIETVENKVAKGTDFSRIASDGTNASGVVNIATDGAHTHTVPAHTHTVGNNSANHTHTLPAMTTNTISQNITGSTGGGLAHNNMPPYEAVYIWERTE